MKWRYFSYGVILCACLAFFYRFFWGSPLVQAQTEQKTEKVSDVENISEFVPLAYGSLSSEFYKQFPGSFVISSGGVLLTGSRKAIDDFKTLILQVDKPPIEYVVDVLLLSVDVSDSSKSGLSILLDTLADRETGITVNISDTGKVFLSSDVSEVLAVLEDLHTKVKIEGRSQLSVMDGSPAQIKSGERRAIITDTQTDGVSVRSSYQYEDIGLQLKVEILPGSDDDFARLKVIQSADNVVAYSYISGDQIPVIGQRRLDTSVSLALGETVVLGGLTQDLLSSRVGGVPFLRSLPFFGGLFRHNVEEKTKSELIVVMRPIVSRADRASVARKAYSQYLRHLKD